MPTPTIHAMTFPSAMSFPSDAAVLRTGHGTGRTSGSRTGAFSGTHSKSRRAQRLALHRRQARIRSILLVLVTGIVTTIAVLGLSARNTDARKREVPTYKYYTSVSVHSGDTLWSIAQDYLSPEYKDSYAYIDEVCRINHLHSDVLIPGDTLMVPYYSTEYKE
jgi:LysM repeat protein